MYVTVYAALVAIVTTIGPVRYAAKRVGPQVAAWLLAVTSVVTAVVTMWALLLLAAPLTVRLVNLDGAAHGRFPSAEPVPGAIGCAAIVAIALAVGAAGRTGIRHHRSIRRLRSHIKPGGPDVVSYADPTPNAYAAAVGGGRIFISTGMLDILSHAECRGVLAHERSHLRHRHSTIQLVSGLAASVNPFLRRLEGDLAAVLERWADEDAAAVTSRPVMATAIGKAALTAASTPPGALAMTDGAHAVIQRVHALRSPAPPGNHLLAIAAATTLALLTIAPAADATTSLVRILHTCGVLLRLG